MVDYKVVERDDLQEYEVASVSNRAEMVHRRSQRGKLILGIAQRFMIRTSILKVSPFFSIFMMMEKREAKGIFLFSFLHRCVFASVVGGF